MDVGRYILHLLPLHSFQNEHTVSDEAPPNPLVSRTPVKGKHTINDEAYDEVNVLLHIPCRDCGTRQVQARCKIKSSGKGERGGELIWVYSLNSTAHFFF